MTISFARTSRAALRPARIVFACTLALSLGGCLINASSHTHYEGKPVSEETLNQIKPGESQALVLALLGEPTAKSKIDETRELWKWSYKQRTTSEGGVFLLLSNSSTTETSGTVFVLTEDGRVQRVWRG